MNDQSSKNEFLAINQLPLKKKLIPQLLLSFSIFSFVFSYVYSSLLIHYSPKLHQYFSAADPYQLLSQGLNKNCIFLICNGLLVFLAKTSGLVQPPYGYSYELEDVLQRRFMGNHGLQDALDQAKEELSGMIEDKEQKPTEEGLLLLVKEEEKAIRNERQPRETFIVNIAESEEGTDAEKDGDGDEAARCWIFDDDDDQVQYEEQQVDNDDEEEEGEEEEEEELNKRIEEFIKRMKEEIIVNESSTD